MITVSTLGEFQLDNGVAVINEETLRSAMLTKLLAYMLTNKDKVLGVDEISSAIWQGEETDNPAGALKNLMYRLRKMLKTSFGEAEYIMSTRGSYRWNSQVNILIDIDAFQENVKKAELELKKNDLKAMDYYEKAITIYKGDFMGKYADLPWMITLSSYYHSMYLTSVKALAELYLENRMFEQLEKLCSKAVKYEQGDEQLYCYLIQARMRMNKVRLAFESYENARSIMEKEVGIRKTVVLNKVYEELLSMDKGEQLLGIDEVCEEIAEEDKEGVFFCGYPIFKEIYHLEVRKNERNPIPQNLVLLTIMESTGAMEKIAEFRVNKAMISLEKIIRECLRVGDVAAKYSNSQYIILLPTCTNEDATNVARRIVSRFNDECKLSDNIKIQVDIEPVSDENSFVDSNDKKDDF